MYTKFGQKPSRKGSVQRCKNGWDDSIKMDLNLI